MISQIYDEDRVVKEVRACCDSLGSVIIAILVIKVWRLSEILMASNTIATTDGTEMHIISNVYERSILWKGFEEALMELSFGIFVTRRKLILR